VSATYTDRLAVYAAHATFEQLPAEAVDAAKTVVLDTLGAILAGSLPHFGGSRATGDLAKLLGGAPECTVIGRGFKTSVANAALANGTMGYAADVEGAGIGRQHISAVLVPTVLALGEREHADGKTLIAALALGYDVGARIDRAADPKTPYPHSFHPSAVFGHFAAAAAAGHFLGLDPAQFANALGLAGINAGGLMVWLNDPTEDSRPYVIGMAAHCGVLAALLAKLGMGGPLGIADVSKYDIYDAFSGIREPSIAETTSDLGELFWITRRGGFKRHPCCGDIHSGIDALVKIVERESLQPDRITRIVHRVHPARAQVIDGNPLKSHCSQYVMAVAAAFRGIPADAIVHDYRESDPRVAALARTTSLVPDRAVEVQQGAIVEVETRDGRRFVEALPHWHGHQDDPFSDAELREKFMRLATMRISREKAERVMAIADDLENLDDAAGLAELLAVPEAG
jgi:2-methylcitrate dehydratase PrpD